MRAACLTVGAVAPTVSRARPVRLNVVTGVPVVLSRAPTLPTPCGYFLFTCVQFFHGRGMALAAPPEGGTEETET